MELAGFRNFRVLGRDSRAGNQDFRPGDVFGTVALVGDCPKAGKASRDRRNLQVGAGNLKAQVQKQFGNSAHADAANADEMHALYLGKHLAV